MYFATLTEIPILQGLIGAGMGKGPLLRFFLPVSAQSSEHAGDKKCNRHKKTAVYVTLVVIMSTLAGFIYGNI